MLDCGSEPKPLEEAAALLEESADVCAFEDAALDCVSGRADNAVVESAALVTCGELVCLGIVGLATVPGSAVLEGPAEVEAAPGFCVVTPAIVLTAINGFGGS